MINTTTTAEIELRRAKAETAEKLQALRHGLALSLRPYSDMRYRAFKETQRDSFYTADDLNTLDEAISLLTEKQD